jgi:hypothetical protein
LFIGKIAMKISAIFVVCLLCLVAPSLMAKSLGDPFDGNKLQNPEWKWKDRNKDEGTEPEKWDVGKTKEGWLHIDAAPNRNLWNADTTNRLYQEHSGDFDVETHVYMEYATQSIVSGVVALSQTTLGKGGKPEWVTMKFWGRGGDAILQFQIREGGIQNEAPGFKPKATKPMDVYIRLARKGKTFTTWWKEKEGDEWNEIEETKTMDLKDPIEIGIYGGNCEAVGRGDIQYEYFRDNLEPFVVLPKQKLPVSWGAIKGRLQSD